MPASPADHLSPHVLRALGAGRLHAAAAADVFAHLDGCAECRQAGVALLGESFLLQLRAARPLAGTLVEPPPPTDTARPLAGTVVEAPPPADTAGPAADPAATAPAAAPAVLPELRDHPQYEVLRELGRGGMGVVYLAKNKLLDRPEVLKVVNPQLLGQAGAADRFLREIRSAARLNHPNIVTAYAALQAGELLAFSMEYVEGQTLAQFVQAHGRLPVVNACYYVQQAALGLQHAFEKGLVHRDIKPQNLILAREGKKHVVKVLDFGLAKATREGEEADRGLTGTGWMLGTPDYIAPEQTLDAARADIRADIYSLGCTLYSLLTGSPPFTGKSQFELLQAHQSKEATPLDQLRPDVPAELAAVVAKMMAKDPAGRYQKPAEVVQALAPFARSGLKPLPAGPPAEATKAGATPAPAGGKTDPGKKGGGQTAARAPVVPGTVVEGSATVARGIKQAAAGPARSDPAAPPPDRGTVIEGSATMARAMKKAVDKAKAPPRKPPSHESEEPEPRPVKKARMNKSRFPIGLVVGGAFLCLLVAGIIVILSQGDSARPGEAGAGSSGGTSEPKGPPRVDAAPPKKTIDRASFDKLMVGMTLTQVEEILGPGKLAVAGDIAGAFQGTKHELLRTSPWTKTAEENRVLVWTEGNQIILAAFPEKAGASSKVQALCYSDIGPDNRRTSYEPGLVLNLITPENFARLKAGMTLAQVEEVLGPGKPALAADLSIFGGTADEYSRKLNWSIAVKDNRVHVWREGNKVILAAFPEKPLAGSKVDALCYSYIATVPNYHWVSSQVGTLGVRAATPENFAKLTAGMTLDQMQEIVGMGRRAATGDLSPALATSTAWQSAVKADRVQVWQEGDYRILAAFPDTPSAGSKAEVLVNSRDGAQKPAGKWVLGGENFGKLKVGMTLKEVEETLGAGKRVSTLFDFPYQPAYKADEQAYWSKVVKEKRVCLWAASTAGKVIVLAAFAEVPSSGTKVEALYYSSIFGTEHKGLLPRAGLAIEFVTMSKAYADKWTLPSKSQLQIGLVHAGGGGAKMGLKRDDVVLRINSRDVLTPKQADTALREIKTGAPVEFVVLRAGKQLELTGLNATEFPQADEVPRLLALAANDARVQTLLAYHYVDGAGVVKSDAEAIKWFRKAAEAGHAPAQNSLGFYYQKGLGLPKNEEEGVRWYRKAAAQDWATAQHNLGYSYQYGLGVKKDLKEAVQWYQKAADQDNARAQTNLAWMYENGQGVRKSEVAAVKWYKRAVVRDDPVAQRNLAIMYENARGGLTYDRAEAVRLYRLAAAQGDPFAQNKLRTLGN